MVVVSEWLIRVPRRYPLGFRARAIALVRAGKQAKQTAVEFGIHPVRLSKWLGQDDIEYRRRPGAPSVESAELRAVRWRIRELETELAIVRQAAKFRDEDCPRARGLYPVVDRLVDAGAPVDRCCRLLGVARQNYSKHKRTPTTPTQLRRQWLTGLIREVHVASRGTYGYRWVHAELTIAMGVRVSSRTVSVLMTLAGIRGLPGPARVKRLCGVVMADDLVNRKFHRLRPNELWVTDITQHRTRGGWLYCAAVLDAFSRIVGWSIDFR